MSSLVDRFGERILGAPVNRGFGRLAWLGPIAMLLVGLGMIYVFLKKYLSRDRGTGQEAAAGEPDADLDPAVKARIEEELKGYRP